MESETQPSRGPVHHLVGRLESALKARDEAAARVKAELHAVAGTDCSRVALDLYRREYNEANDLFCDLLLMNAAAVVGALKAQTHAADIVESIRAIAREAGWAIGVHGSMVQHFKNASDAVRLLRLVLPHIPPTAIDGEKARTRRVSECYLNTAVRELIAAYEESNAKDQGAGNGP